MRQLEIALASSGGSERLFRVHCRPIVAKIESDAKMIAALREALGVVLRAFKAHLAMQYAPAADRAGLIAARDTAVAALAAFATTDEQTVEESK